jgi:hypothetical protein
MLKIPKLGKPVNQWKTVDFIGDLVNIPTMIPKEQRRKEMIWVLILFAILVGGTLLMGVGIWFYIQSHID